MSKIFKNVEYCKIFEHAQKSLENIALSECSSEIKGDF